MSDLFIPGQTVGIIGGGYQARLLGLAAKTMGYHVGILAAENDCLASDIADWQVVADVNDEMGLFTLAEKSDVITTTTPIVTPALLEGLDEYVSIPESIELFKFSQDRLLKRLFLEEANVNIPPYNVITKMTDLEATVDSIGFPCVLKTVSPLENEEDELVLNKMADLRYAMEMVSKQTCILEAMIPFEKEIIVSIAGNGNGEYTIFPLVDVSLNSDNRTFRSIVPAGIAGEIKTEIKRVVQLIAETLSLQGLLTVELLITEHGLIYVHDLQHGPHHGGNYTLEGTNLSQYEAHLRGLFGWKLPEIELIKPAVSQEIIGDKMVDTISCIPFYANWYHHYYGRSNFNPDEIVGHVTILTDSISTTLEELNKTQIWDKPFQIKGEN